MIEPPEARAELLVIAGELQQIRSRLLDLLAALGPNPDLEAELQAVLGGTLQDCMEPLIRNFLSFAKETASEPVHGTVAHLDLRRNDEVTRYLLSALVIKDYFLPRQMDKPRNVWVPLRTPEQADLHVDWDHGYWFASWLKPGASGASGASGDDPAGQPREIVLLEQDPTTGSLRYRELGPPS